MVATSSPAPDVPPPDGAGMTFHRPRRAPAGAVRRLAGFAGRPGPPVARTELPSCGVPIILSFGDSVRLVSATGSGSYPQFVAGPHEIPVDTSHSGSLRCVQLDLTPLGAYQLLGVPVSELRDRVVPLDALPDRSWARVGERLATLGSWPERFALLDELIARVASTARQPDPQVRWAWRRLVRTGGRAPVRALAAEVGWSRRHFTDRFRQQVGLPPKAAGQLLRFTRAHRLLASGAGRSISDIAAEVGYADHSHLVREFRRLTGRAPSQLALDSRRAEPGNHLAPNPPVHLRTASQTGRSPRINRAGTRPVPPR